MSKFLRLKNSLIKKEDISYLEYYADASSEVEENELEIGIIYGDVCNIPYDTKEEYIKEIEYIEKESGLFKLNEGMFINLNQVSFMEFYEDKYGPIKGWFASILWKDAKDMPSTFVLDDVIHDEETIKILMDSIEEGIN